MKQNNEIKDNKHQRTKTEKKIKTTVLNQITSSSSK